MAARTRGGPISDLASHVLSVDTPVSTFQSSGFTRTERTTARRICEKVETNGTLAMPWQADPEISTRERFTEVNLMFRLPEGADKDYAEIFKTSQHLYRLLAYHPAMEPNLQQTFNTPANSKNKVYFSVSQNNNQDFETNPVADVYCDSGTSSAGLWQVKCLHLGGWSG